MGEKWGQIVRVGVCERGYYVLVINLYVRIERKKKKKKKIIPKLPNPEIGNLDTKKSL
jgi:hypothetical protein